MSNVRELLWLVPALPLIAATLIAFLGPRFLRGQSHWPCIAAIAGSCVVLFVVLATVRGWIAQGEDTPREVKRSYTWIQAGEIEAPDNPDEPARPRVDIGFSLRADPLSAIMAVTVTFIGLLI